jgi:hypothetical protein
MAISGRKYNSMYSYHKNDKTSPGFQVSKDSVNLLLYCYGTGGCMTHHMLVCVSVILRGRIGAVYHGVEVYLEGLGYETVIAGLVQVLLCL